MVFIKQVPEHLASSSGADGVANTVFLWKCFDLVKVVLKVQVLPAVGVADSRCRAWMCRRRSSSKGLEPLVRRYWSLFSRPLRPSQATGLGRGRGCRLLVRPSQRECMSALRCVCDSVSPTVGESVESAVCQRPGGKANVVEAISMVSSCKSCFQRAHAVFPRPNLMQGRLDHSKKIPSVCGEDVTSCWRNTMFVGIAVKSSYTWLRGPVAKQ